MAPPRINRSISLSEGDGLNYWPGGLDDDGSMDERRATKITQQSKRIVEPAYATHRKSPCIALVLTALMRMDHDHTFNSTSIATFMNEYYRQYVWTNRTVGKIIGLIKSAEECGPTNNDGPIRKANKGSTVHYKLRRDIYAWHWLIEMRDAFAEAAEGDILQCRQTGEMPRMDDERFIDTSLKANWQN